MWEETESVGDSHPLVLVSGSSNCRTHNVRTLIRVIHNVKRVVIYTPANIHSKVSHTFAVRILALSTICAALNLRICTYSNAPISYIGVTCDRLYPHGPSLVLNNVGRNDGTSAGTRCDNAMNVTVRNTLGNIPSVTFSLYSFSTRTGFRPVQSVIIRLIHRALTRNLPRCAYLGIGIPMISTLRNAHCYHVTRNR